MFEINLLSKAPSEVAGVTGNAGAIGSVTVGTVGTVGGGAGEGMKGGVAVHQVAMEVEDSTACCESGGEEHDEVSKGGEGGREGGREEERERGREGGREVGR
jgi:hypothetical protein